MPDIPERPSGARFSNINLRVSEDERWAFKTWCSTHRVSQVDAFREAFELLKEKYDRKGVSDDPD